MEILLIFVICGLIFIIVNRITLRKKINNLKKREAMLNKYSYIRYTNITPEQDDDF